MIEFAKAGAAVGSTPATLEKTRILATYFRTLDEDDLRRAAVFMSGRAFPPSQRRTLGLGWSTLNKVVASVSDRGENDHAVSTGAFHAREPCRNAGRGV